MIKGITMTANNIAYADNLPKHIKKGHQLVFSRQDLSAREADMFALMMAYMKPQDWENETPSYEFPCAKLAEWLQLDARHVGTVLAPIADRLAQRKIGIESANAKGDTEFDHVPLFKRIQYKNGVLKIIPNDELKSEYIEYNKGFALINTVNFLGLKKEYAKRLYELLSRFKDKGTVMRRFSIEELKGLFGILDEKDRLKKDKQSFKSTGVFMQRCIRDSIKELMNNQATNKEILFLPSGDKKIGYKPLYLGRKIVGVDFLYRWVSNSTTITTFNTQDAEKTIRELEQKRVLEKIQLDNKELELLAMAYKEVGRDDRATKILNSLANRKEEESVVENEALLSTFLDKIDTMIETVGENDLY